MNVKFRPFYIAQDLEVVRRHIPLVFVEDMRGIVVENADTHEPLAFAVFHTWQENSVCAHQIVLHRAAIRHGFYEHIAEYVYRTAGRNIIYGLVPSDNKKALKLNTSIGFTERAVLPDYYSPGVDLHVLELRKEDCRFLRKANGRQEQSSPTS